MLGATLRVKFVRDVNSSMGHLDVKRRPKLHATSVVATEIIILSTTLPSAFTTWTYDLLLIDKNIEVIKPI